MKGFPAAVFLAAGVVAAGGRQAPPEMDQAKIDAATERGVKYLKERVEQGYDNHHGPGDKELRSDEIILWTFLHAGVPENDPLFQKLFQKMIGSDLATTYNVSLQAMILEEMDRAGHQARIAQCAQFLVDNQCKNGQWSYGEPVATVGKLPPDSPTPGGDGEGRKKTKTRPRVAVRKTIDGPEIGDNSNSQYAALGLRACHDAGIVLPQDVIDRAVKCWHSSQRDGNKKGDPKAWGYRHYKEETANPYGSMTAGAIGSLAIYAYILGGDWKRDKAAVEGMAWMARNFSMTENPGPPEGGGGSGAWFYYYYLYAMERAGLLCGMETIGSHHWYPEGVEVLLRAQDETGWWQSSMGERITDTCFAILFLRRATRPLIPVATQR